MIINVDDVSVDVEDVLLVTVQSSKFRVSCVLVGFVKVCILHCFVDLFKKWLEHLLVAFDAELVLALEYMKRHTNAILSPLPGESPLCVSCA